MKYVLTEARKALLAGVGAMAAALLAAFQSGNTINWTEITTALIVAFGTGVATWWVKNRQDQTTIRVDHSEGL